MTYTKPTNVSYTDMCIWIDNNVYTDTCDDLKLYEYLYHLANMLAHEHKYFIKYEYYDEFALYSASKLFMRLRDPRQFSSDGLPKLTQVKSVLNYLKTVIYPYKVDFEQQFYAESTQEFSITLTDTYDLGTHLSEETTVFDRIEFSTTLSEINSIIKQFLGKIPRKLHDPEWDNIYVSCMLTLLDSITVTQEILESSESISDNISLDKVYKQLNDNPPILYHLDSSMSNYIKLLVNEIKHLIAKLLTVESRYEINEEASTKSLIISSLGGDD